MNHRAGGNAGVGNHAVGANAHALAQRDLALEHAVDIDRHILRAGQGAAHIQPGRVGQAHTLLHELQGHALLPGALQLSQLNRAVDASHLQRIGNAMGHHRQAIGHSELDHIGEVILALRIVGVEPGQPVFELPRRCGHDAAVDLLDLALLGAGVFVLDDGLHRLTGAQNTPITRGVGKCDGQQGQPLASAGSQQRAQGIGTGQGHITREHQHHALIAEQRGSLQHRVAGTELWLLAHALRLPGAGSRCGPRHMGLDFSRTVTRHHHHLARLQRSRSVKHMLQQRPAREQV